MRLHTLGAIAAVLLCALIAAPFAANIGIISAAAPPPLMASAFLKVKDPLGHGSGVHIGNGYVLTAAHVVQTNKTMTVIDSEHREMAGEVLWSNTEYDVALIRLPGARYVASAPLSCAANFVHQRVTVYGNPIDLEFVFTDGQVSGTARKWAIWREVVPVDLTIIPGQSGGAAIDETGYVVGIAVGVMIWQYGLTGQGFIVPSSVICQLMGRA